MKKLILPLCFVATVATAPMFAQAPSEFKYQAAVRTASGEVIANKQISIRIGIYQGQDTSQLGTNVYTETHMVTTSQYGLVNLNIGRGNVVSGDISSVNWASGRHFIQIEMDDTGGSQYRMLGVSELLSVPYSLHSNVAEDVLPGSTTIQNEIAARKSA
ncbi:MAG TPA: hypothetical protein VEC36_00345, partial [Patescibacteria group bacterium]|nr:hypothetical protein [Patescibacteria group bacterium]